MLFQMSSNINSCSGPQSPTLHSSSNSKNVSILFDKQFLKQNFNIDKLLGQLITQVQEMKRITTNTFHIISKQPYLENQTLLKLHENTGGLNELPMMQIQKKFGESKNAVFLMNFISVFFDQEAKMLTKFNQDIVAQITKLASNTKNTIVILSEAHMNIMEHYFGQIANIILISVRDQLIKQVGHQKQGVQFSQIKKQFYYIWKPAVQTHIEQFVDKTPGSQIINNENCLKWQFEEVNKEFADIQKNALIQLIRENIKEVQGIEIYHCSNQISIRPICMNQVLIAPPSSTDKATLIIYLII